MPIYEFTSEKIDPLTKTTFADMQLYERNDLQRLLRENISVIAPDTLVIAEEFAEWSDSGHRIDLVGIDTKANLVVFELKRTEDGDHMDLQAIRYAAMVSKMTFDQAVGIFSRHLTKFGKDDIDARADLLDFLGWDEPDEEAFAHDVRIVLVSAGFSLPLTTSVLWLIEHAIDVRCVRLQPYNLNGRVLVDVQQIIPLPEADRYQVRIQEKERKVRAARSSRRDTTPYDLTLGDQLIPALPKRQAILQVFRYLVDNGVVPEDITGCFHRCSFPFRSIEGEIGPDEFTRLAWVLDESQGGSFDPQFFFCKEDELVHFGGRTYAVYKQWAGNNWLQTMNNLRDTFPNLKIVFSRSEQ